MATIDVTSPDGCSTWPLETAACADFATMSAPVTGIAASIAVSNLYRLTGHRFGQCEITYRPCRELPSFVSTYRRGGVAVTPGRSVNMDLLYLQSNSSFGTACSDCTGLGANTLTLPAHPINAVVGANMAGDVIPASEFAIVNRREIIWRSPSGATFPASQDLSKPVGEDGTWSITVNKGVAIPSPDVTAWITGIYACEIAKEIMEEECALPSTVQTMTRQGVTYQFVNEEYIERGLVGHPLIDRFILSLNPHRLVSAPSVHSIDSITDRTVVETWTGS